MTTDSWLSTVIFFIYFDFSDAQVSLGAMDTQCSSKRIMSSYKEGRTWLCKWLLVLHTIILNLTNFKWLLVLEFISWNLTNFKLRFSNKELKECESLCRDDSGSLGFQCRWNIVLLLCVHSSVSSSFGLTCLNINGPVTWPLRFSLWVGCK